MNVRSVWGAQCEGTHKSVFSDSGLRGARVERCADDCVWGRLDVRRGRWRRTR